jgi:hypothetical protein
MSYGVRFLATVVCVSVLQVLSAAELPVRQVVLYKHGVGFFERSGSLAPGETARLDFKAAEMNDVLKSLTVNEKGGGKVSGLRYDSSVPLERKLADYPFKIADGQPISAVLDQLRGARMEIQFGTEKAAGVIVSARSLAAVKDAPEREQITLLLDSGDLRTYDLSAASNMRFSDVKLQGQFKDYLIAVADARSADKRSVYVDSTDSKPHDLTASYIIPSPVWKSSYRLIFEGAQPTLEGWAIVDNTTGEDWTNVRMSLVSGKPISFISALYEPKYVQRLTAELAEDRPMRPNVYSGAMSETVSVNGAVGAAPMARSAGGAGSGAPGGVMGSVSGYMPTVVTKASPAFSSVLGQATARELGELFEYQIAQPVTIRKNESAMLPFLQQKITGRKLLIYSDQSTQNPLQAAELTNSTGKTLDGGPITVFDGGAYGGEALVETVKSGDKRLISYAVDLGTRITTAYDSKNAMVREVHVNRGVLTARYASEETKTYTVRNVDAKAKTLIVEHQVRAQYTLLSPNAREKSPDAYRFEVALPAASTQKLAVAEERVYATTVQLTNFTTNQMATYTQNKVLSDAARRQLEQVLDSKRQIAALDGQARELQTQIDNLNHDQDRLRQNIMTLNNVSGQQQQVQGYATKMGAQEGQIATLQDQRIQLQQRRGAAQEALDTLMQNMEF